MPYAVLAASFIFGIYTIHYITKEVREVVSKIFAPPPTPLSARETLLATPNKFYLKQNFRFVWAVMMESMSDLNVLEVWRACTIITSIISLLCYKASLMPGTEPLPLILVLMASNSTVGFFVKV